MKIPVTSISRMSSSSSLNNLQRIANGVTLIAKEIVKKTTQNPNAKDFKTLVASSLKSAVVSATDLTGLTKGKVRSFPKSNNNSTLPTLGSDELLSSSSKSSSVVYFNDVEEVASSASPQRPQAEVIVETDKEEEERNVVNIEADLVHKVEEDVKSNEVPKEITAAVVKRRKPRERRVPTTPFSRAMGFAGLGAGLVWGTIQESTNRLIYGTDNSQNNQSAISPFLSEKNAERLANALCRMRGAALKLGQMLSIQDESLVPAPILAALDIVRQGADVMPRKQLNQVLDTELGTDWSTKLRSFDYEPLAAASIGQVHQAVMKDGTEVAMKIQYPGVADSIESDIENVKLLLDYTNLIPKGLYLDRAMKVAKEELSRECDYLVEATNQKRFRELVSDTAGFYVPIVVDEISSKRVLTTELVAGVPIDKVASLDQSTRNDVGTKLLELTLKELFVFRFMQTDPNWGNFLYDNATRTINLIDFGAARDYPKNFVDDYLQMVMACANNDRETSIEMSKRLGFLTGMESEVMLDAHVQAGFVVGLPFSKPGGFDFRSTNITQSVSNLGARMLKHRLTPPPDEAYSLHRKLSGAFLACIKLGAVVPCRELLLDVYEHYKFGEDSVDLLSSSFTA